MQKEAENILNYYIRSWNLICEGEGILTHSSIIQPVLYDGTKSVLKIPFSAEEKRGNKLMTWWDGVGAAKVLKYDDGAILMERITGNRTLKAMVSDNRDEEATRIICRIASLLHSHKKEPLPELTPLNIWFGELFLSAGKYGSIFAESAAIASSLLKDQRNVTVLHGDLHHDNILFSAEKGWLAIDPKGLWGEETFDYVNILCNPDKQTALSKDRLNEQINIIVRETGTDRRHLLKWTIAWAGLSATWFINDNLDASLPLGVAEIVLRELNN